MDRCRVAAPLLLLVLFAVAPSAAQQTVHEPVFHTFSIVGLDRTTGETGVAVTTRNDCVGNRVPHVRAGVGAVATQASTRFEYGPEILDLLEEGMAPEVALRTAMAPDSLSARRQIGVIDFRGATAQHTGDQTPHWSGQRSGDDYATQGNVLVGPEVVAAVAGSFEETRGSGRTLADRLLRALEAGQRMGGDARKGRLQSAAVLVADPREGASPRVDGITVDIHVCEHPTPVAELRRIQERVSGTLGFRTLSLTQGPDVWQLHVLLHALDYYRPLADSIPFGAESERYTDETAEAVESFRRAQGLATAADGIPRGFVNRALVEALWSKLEDVGAAAETRLRIRAHIRVRR